MAVRYPGLAADARGFLATKQAFLAFLQADAAADAIAAEVIGTAARRAAFDPVPRRRPGARWTPGLKEMSALLARR